MLPADKTLAHTKHPYHPTQTLLYYPKKEQFIDLLKQNLTSKIALKPETSTSTWKNFARYLAIKIEGSNRA